MLDYCDAFCCFRRSVELCAYVKVSPEMLRIFFVVLSGPLQSNVLIMGLHSGALDFCAT